MPVKYISLNHILRRFLLIIKDYKAIFNRFAVAHGDTVKHPPFRYGKTGAFFGLDLMLLLEYHVSPAAIYKRLVTAIYPPFDVPELRSSS